MHSEFIFLYLNNTKKLCITSFNIVSNNRMYRAWRGDQKNKLNLQVMNIMIHFILDI